MKTKIDHIKGDATSPPSLHTPALIAHVCNDRGAWGAGFVMALNKTFGEGPMNAYRDWHERGSRKRVFSPAFIVPNNVKVEETGYFKLGEVQLVHVGNRTCIANMVAQQGTRSNDDVYPPIRYGALTDCMRAIAKQYKHEASQLFQAGKRDSATIPFEIHCPKFGSDLAGGSWEEIEKLINEIWLEAGIPVTVYEYDPNAVKL